MIKQSLQKESIKFRDAIRRMIHAVFNKEYFGSYEAIVDVVHTESSTVDITIPELKNLKLIECKVAFPGGGVTSTYNVGDKVLLLCNSFSLDNAIVIGSVAPLASTSLNEVILRVGSSSILINESGVYLNGPAVRAGSDDLLDDDTGAL